MDPNRFLTHSLRQLPASKQITSILQAAMQAVDPIQAVYQSMSVAGNRLRVAGRTYDLRKYKNLIVVGFGKASAAMAEGVGTLLGERVSRGALILKHSEPEQATRIPAQIEILQGNHPIPGENSLTASNKLLETVQGAGEDDLILCLISGGGSALFTQPQDGITLEELQQLTRLLLASGAEIGEINTLRKHLDRVKGGGLARLAAPAEVVTLIVSDVIGSPLDVIASGPTVPDSSTYADALHILEKYHLVEQTPVSILNVLSEGVSGLLPETLKAGDPLVEHVHNTIIADNFLAAQAAVERAQALGWNTLLLTTYLHGEAQQVGMMLGGVLRQVASSGDPLARPACIVAGGETTVTLRGDGLGGRNQELALGAVAELAGLEGVVLVALATDGDDGPTNAAGAVVTGETLSRGQTLGLHPSTFLARNDSYPYFQTLGDLLLTGPSGTNVNDLTFLFALPQS
jgi:glycerate 2-kinase